MLAFTPSHYLPYNIQISGVPADEPVVTKDPNVARFTTDEDAVLRESFG